MSRFGSFYFGFVFCVYFLKKHGFELKNLQHIRLRNEKKVESVRFWTEKKQSVKFWIKKKQTVRFWN